MRTNSTWKKLGYNNSFWEFVRFYCSLRGKDQKNFLATLKDFKTDSEWQEILGYKKDYIELLPNYLSYREERKLAALDNLRTEEQSMAYCQNKSFCWAVTKTKNKDHHQSSKTVIAAVTAIAGAICARNNVALVANPQKRCVWSFDGELHVSARNLDGAIPTLRNPSVVWEIKEYWGKTSGGSKMSDAVYECQLVGKEIREFEHKTKQRIWHIIFVDGKEQWMKRKSDLARFIDLESQGLIDYLFIGKEIENHWGEILEEIIKTKNIKAK